MQKQKRNKIERLKAARRPYDAQSVLKEESGARMDEDLRFFLKNFGIYNHKLAPERYVLRLRIPGGTLKREHFAKTVETAEALGAGLTVTARAQLELHGLSFPDALEAYRRLEAAGLTSWQTFSDNVRNILTHPLDGIGADGLIACGEALTAMERLYLKQPEWVGMLPRKFNAVLAGHRHMPFSPFANDLAFVVAQKEGEVGFNVYAGGKNTEGARSLDLFVTPDEAPALFKAVLKFYKEAGPRESRSRARLFHMMESMGLKAFREGITARFEADARAEGESLFEGVRVLKEREPLQNGKVALRYMSRWGELDMVMAKEVLAICREQKIETIRLGADQNLYLPGAEGATPRLQARRYGGMLACTGARRCVYSLTDNQAVCEALDLKECERLGITVGLSGCLKGCGRHAFSDIGLVGIRTKLYGPTVERGVRLYLGAEPSRPARPGRLILYGVPLRALNGMLGVITALFEASGHRRFECFAKEELNRFSEPALAFWLLYNLALSQKEAPLLPLPKERNADEKALFASRVTDETVRRALETQEAYPFREAIVLLERRLFQIA